LRPLAGSDGHAPNSQPTLQEHAEGGMGALRRDLALAHLEVTSVADHLFVHFAPIWFTPPTF
jgi:hypothetical protein